MRRAQYGRDWDYEDGAECERVEAGGDRNVRRLALDPGKRDRLDTWNEHVVRHCGFSALFNTEEYKEKARKDRKKMIALHRKNQRRDAEWCADSWINAPQTRLRITQPFFWWQKRDPERYQVPDWKIMENARNDWNRAVRIKHGMQEQLPGQPTLDKARYMLLCEIIYQKKKEALAKQTAA